MGEARVRPRFLAKLGAIHQAKEHRRLVLVEQDVRKA
jgi:hypothetical protein